MPHIIKEPNGDRYMVKTILGIGAFGVVFLVDHVRDPTVDFANTANHTEDLKVLKKVNMSKLSNSHIRRVRDEAKIMSRLSHKHIVKYHSSFELEEVENSRLISNLYIVMEYCEGGDLHRLVASSRSKGKYLREEQIWKLFIQIALGLEFIHKNSIIHRDLKPLNLFLDRDENVKIGDLGVARLVSSQESLAFSFVGTPYYLSPEICRNQPYDYKSDVWSLGCVLYELAMLRPPFQGKNQGALILNIVYGQLDPVKSRFSKELRGVINQLLSKSPRSRPSIEDLISKGPVYEKAVQLNLINPIDSKKPGPINTAIKKPDFRSIIDNIKKTRIEVRPISSKNTDLRRNQASPSFLTSQACRFGMPSGRQMNKSFIGPKSMNRSYLQKDRFNKTNKPRPLSHGAANKPISIDFKKKENKLECILKFQAKRNSTLECLNTQVQNIHSGEEAQTYSVFQLYDDLLALNSKDKAEFRDTFERTIKERYRDKGPQVIKLINRALTEINSN